LSLNRLHCVTSQNLNFFEVRVSKCFPHQTFVYNSHDDDDDDDDDDGDLLKLRRPGKHFTGNSLSNFRSDILLISVESHIL
jgi:hypothetical protein